MTPGARVAAAIEVLHDMSEGLAGEQALTRWGRRSRFAGSKDRAAVRDHVFDVLRVRRTAAHYGQGETPRALMIGMLHAQGADLEALFTGDGHAPVPLTEDEARFPAIPSDRATAWNLPDWLMPAFEASLGDASEDAALALQARAPISLRVNIAKTTRAAAQAALLAEGVETAFNPLCDTALLVTGGPRKVRGAESYTTGLVELQDGASQALIAELPQGARVLDYCAGGGGKALAIAAQPDRAVFAHDIDPRRMADLPQRALRAGALITPLATEDIASAAPFDVVLCDAPCSGSGAWRRAPEGKWILTQARLSELAALQSQILDDTQGFVLPGGALVYATCSVLQIENEERITSFLKRHPGWRCVSQRRFAVGPQGDGLFASHLIRDQ